MTTSQRVIRWLVFGVVIAIVPLAAAWLFSMMKGGHPGYRDVVGSREIFLVSIALCGAAIGDVVTSPSRKLELKLISGGCTLVVLLLSSLLFAGVSEARMSGTPTDPGMVALISTLLFGLGLISCGCCVATAEA